MKHMSVSIVPFLSVKLAKNETYVFEHSSHSVSRSLKNETDVCEHGSHSMSSSLKNETDVLKHAYFLFQACVKMKQVFEHSLLLVLSSLKNKTTPQA